MYTFLALHKHAVPSITTLEASVRSMTKTELKLEDFARIKAVCPDMFHFAYVPTALLHAERPTKRRRGQHDKDLYEPEQDPHAHTLVFEFLDQDMMSQKATSRRYVPASKSRHEAAMQLVSRRNATFARAMQELIMASAHSGQDPLELLREASEAVMPLDPALPKSSGTPARVAISRLIETLPQVKWWRDQIVPGGRRTFPARSAQYGTVDPPLSAAMIGAIERSHGIRDLYTHQAAALTHFQRGLHVVVSTGTSSGKSLVYQIPIANALAKESDATAMCIFPTKALTQDQLASLRRLLAHHPDIPTVDVEAYDGDTPADERSAIRENVRVLFTNPDMLHQAILPHEDKWRRFLRGLRVVVMDELHVYTGIFGTHVSLIFRRLRRLCAALGNERIQFVSCSATISEPTKHMANVLGIEPSTIGDVREDGAPCGQKEWVVWNPPLIDPHEPGNGRVSAFTEVSQLFCHLILHGIRTIVFAKVRRTCEIIIRQIREDLVHEGHPELAERVHAYRSGYAPADRRKLEHDMASGHVMGLVATSALELGVDIGVLDAVILFGVPYSPASMWQQAGRAGRRQNDALVVLLGEAFPVDQYYTRHPELVFELPNTKLWIDPENELLLEAHVRCAAHEMPCSEADVLYFGERGLSMAKRFCEPDEDGYYHSRDIISPAIDLPIRGARQDTYKYVDATNGFFLEEVEVERVYFEAYEGAVFLHQGTTYVCESVHHDARLVRLARRHVLYHTRPRDLTDIDACQTWRIRTLPHSDVHAFYGRVDVIFRVWGYFKVDRRANILDTVDIDAAPFVRETQGVWIDVPWSIIEELTRHDILAPAAIHAAEHAVLSLTPLFVASSADDVRTECKIAMRELSGRPTQRKRPSRLIFYDKPGQNAGICAQVFEHFGSLLHIALGVMERCRCTDGCPSCIETPHCLHDNTVTSKRGAMAVLRGLLHKPMFDQWDEPTAETGDCMLSHTLCAAQPVPQRDDTHIEHIVEAPYDAHLDLDTGNTTQLGSSLFFDEGE